MNPSALPVVDLQILEAALLSRLAGRIKFLQVRLQDDSLVLEGQTATYYAKQLAQEVLMQHSRLPIRANAIEVR